MRNLSIKICLATISLLSVTSFASAVIPVDVPEPGTFGMFAGAVAVAIILSRIIKKK